MTLSTEPHDPPAPDIETDAYGFFNHMRNTSPVWRGTLMESDLMPEELKNPENWTLFDFESVFTAFREDTVFASEMYNQTIGLVFGPTILGMAGKQHHDHRSLVSKAFKQSALNKWEPEVIDPICDQLVDEFKDAGEVDLVKAVTFEFPTRVTAALLGLPQEDLEMFRRLSLDLISITEDIEAGLNASVELGTYFQDQVDQRRSAMTDDVIGDLVAAEIDGESSPTRRSSRSCVCCCPPASRPHTGHRATCCNCSSLIPPNSGICSRIEASCLPRSRRASGTRLHWSWWRAMPLAMSRCMA